MVQRVIVLAVFLPAAIVLIAQVANPGDLDPTFGGGGIVVTQFIDGAEPLERPYAMKVNTRFSRLKRPLEVSTSILALHRRTEFESVFERCCGEEDRSIPTQRKEPIMKIKSFVSTVISIIAFTLAVAVNAPADTVTDWNRIAVQEVINAGATRPGGSGALDVATVQLAVYDAVQAIVGEYQPYHVVIPGATGSTSSAAAKAARDVLVNRFPSRAAAIEAIYQQYLIDHSLNPTDPGVAVGATAAAGIITLRASDGSFPNPPPAPFVGSMMIGVWRPTPPANAPMAASWLGFVTPFALNSPSQFRAQPSPDLNSPEYTRDYEEVKLLGKSDSTARTAAQTDLAHFWNLNYVAVWCQVTRTLAEANIANIGDSARLLALVSMSMADSAITSWDSKSAFVFWRPITAIREGDNDGNPKTAGDPTWSPLVTTPPYPDHTSGANNITASATRSLALFFGTNEMNFSVTTTNLGPTVQDTRDFTKFSDAQQEVVDGRIYEGIHFRFADEAARKQGRQVAQWAHSHFLRPIGE